MAEQTNDGLTGLERRLLQEPDYRPYCLGCQVMTRMKLIYEDGARMMWCEPIDENHPLDAYLPGVAPKRKGCGMKFNIHTGKIVVRPSGPWAYKRLEERHTDA